MEGNPNLKQVLIQRCLPNTKITKTSKKKKMKPTKRDDFCQSQVTLRDLCPQDKARVRQLVEDLARLGTEKEKLEVVREKEKLAYEEQVSVLHKRHALIMKERANLEEQLKDSQESLKCLQSSHEEEENKRPDKPVNETEQTCLTSHPKPTYTNVPNHLPTLGYPSMWPPHTTTPPLPPFFLPSSVLPPVYFPTLPSTGRATVSSSLFQSDLNQMPSTLATNSIPHLQNQINKPATSSSLTFPVAPRPQYTLTPKTDMIPLLATNNESTPSLKISSEMPPHIATASNLAQPHLQVPHSSFSHPQSLPHLSNNVSNISSITWCTLPESTSPKPPESTSPKPPESTSPKLPESTSPKLPESFRKSNDKRDSTPLPSHMTASSKVDDRTKTIKKEIAIQTEDCEVIAVQTESTTPVVTHLMKRKVKEIHDPPLEVKQCELFEQLKEQEEEEMLSVLLNNQSSNNLLNSHKGIIVVNERSLDHNNDSCNDSCCSESDSELIEELFFI